ncbi:MAG: ion transporter [Bacteroidales bacterium]|jgi:voltage-gated sodium channel|nr:ion transporter [Bacteroidales bacterium]
MGYVILLIAILFFVYSIIGVFVFGPADAVNFGDLHHASVTLFKILTLEGWTDIMEKHVYGPAPDGGLRIVSVSSFAYFASFILIGAMIIMNLFIGVIMNSMEESQKELSEEIREIKYRDENQDDLYRHLLDKIDELRDEIRSLKK